MHRILPLMAALMLSAGTARACSCFGNSSFCETLDSAWFEPDAVALVVPLESYYYGMYAQVVHVVGGIELPDTIMVWGDNGALCRIGMGFLPGDTVMLGLNRTDFGGNIIHNPDYPPDLEQEGDYMVSVCGVHVLDYDHGMVTGWITGPQGQSMTMEEFTSVVDGCFIPTGIDDPVGEDPLSIADNGGKPTLSLTTPRNVQLRLMDAVGRCVIDRNWDGSPLRLPELPAGTYVAQLRLDDRMMGSRVTVGGTR